MKCANVQESLAEYLLNELDDRDKACVEDHVGACPACQAELHKLSEAIAILCSALPGRPVSDTLRHHIQSRCNSEPSLVDSMALPPASRLESHASAGEMLWAFAAGILLMAALQIAFATAAIYKASPRVAAAIPRPESSATFGANDPKDKLEVMEQRSVRTKFVALHRPTKTDDRNGQLMWDELNREVHVYCFGLPQPPTGMQYTLCLVGKQQTVRIADELKVDAHGACRAVARWPAGEFHSAQVTLSPRSALDTTSKNEVALISDL